MADAPKHRFEALDAFRGIFAVLIVLYHFAAYGYFYDLPIVRNASRGVEFFFMLSGFVITSAYLDKLRDNPNFVDFLVKRLGRLWPLHIVMLALLVVLEVVKFAAVHAAHVGAGQAPFHGENSLPSLVGNVFLLNGLGIFQGFTWNGPAWSISAEFFVYLVFYLLAGKYYRYCAIAFAAVAAVAMVWFRVPPHFISVSQGYGAVSCLFYFFVGSLLFLGFRSRKQWARPWMEWAAAALLIFTMCVDIDIGQLMMPIVFALSIWIFAHQSGTLSRLMMTKVPQYLGRTSYSIYLVHFVVIQYVMAIVRVADKKLHLNAFKTVDGTEVFVIGNRLIMDALAIGLLLGVIAIAGVTYRFIEQPGQRFAAKLAARLKPTRPKGRRSITWIS